MLEITVNINAPELAAAIQSLAASLGKDASHPLTHEAIAADPVSVDPQPAQTYPQNSTPVTGVVAPQQVMPDPNAVAMQQAQQQANQFTPPITPGQIPPQTVQVMPPASTPAPAVVPTTTVTYTMDQLAVAATQLMDAGRRDELIGLLAKYNVQALTALPKEMYGAFATDLRAMGARI